MKKIIMGLMIISILVLSGCDQIDFSKIAKEAVVCENPYIRVGTGCCLDANDNSICDKDETVTQSKEIEEEVSESEETQEVGELSCSDECSIDICKGREYVACLKQADGCYDEVSKGKIISKCGVQCLIDSDCYPDKKCELSKCVILEVVTEEVAEEEVVTEEVAEEVIEGETETIPQIEEMISNVVCSEGKISGTLTNIGEETVTVGKEMKILFRGLVVQYPECDTSELGPGESTFCTALNGPFSVVSGQNEIAVRIGVKEGIASVTCE